MGTVEAQTNDLAKDSPIDATDVINASYKAADQSEITIRQPGRTIVVEPLIFFMAFGFFPLILVTNLFVYDQFKKELCQETGFNCTALDLDTQNDTCNTNKTSPEYIFTQEVQRRNAYFNMCSSLCMSVPALFATLLLSPYCDKAGRRYAILPPVIGGCAYSISLFVVIAFKLSPWFTLIGQFVTGLSGGYQLMFVGIYAYISDTTPPENRRFRMTLINIIMMATATTGPIAFGYWVKHSGFLWPALFAVVTRLLNAAYAVFFIPETVVRSSTDVRVPFFTLTHLKRGVRVFTTRTGNGRRWQLACLMTAFILCFFASEERGIDTLFELNSPLCWDSVLMGYYTTVYLAVSAIGGTVVAWAMKYCATDVTAAILAGAMAMVHYTYKGFVTKTYQLFISMYYLYYMYVKLFSC